MNVLSLFDGISCARVALERAGIPVERYFASEIDKYAVSITKYNFPDTEHIGDVRGVFAKDLPKIDLLLGGSPCQGLSLAGKRLNFDDPRSALFFEYVRILKELQEINPNVKFLLENVPMKKEVQDAISAELGVEPVMINSALVSAQNRKRLYWANFEITQPEDKGILLRDIILNGAVDREKSHAIAASIGRTTHREYLQRSQGQMVYGAALRGRGPNNVQQLESNGTEKSNALTTAQKDTLLLEFIQCPVVVSNIYGGFKETEPRVHTTKSPTIRTAAGGGHIPSTVDIEKLYLSDDALTYMSRTYAGKDRFEKYPNDLNGKAGTLTASMFKGVPYGVVKALLRKLHPIECERLQTLPDHFTATGVNGPISNTQRYKAIGNGWTCDVIAHILQGIK